MSDTVRGLVCGGLALAVSGLLLALLRPLRGTTLVAPWAWTLLAVWTVAGVELAAVTVGRNWSPGELAAWRYLAVTAALCPGMAVLGAKRPQDRAWSFIVAALWGMLGLPALKVLLLPAVATLSLHPAQSWFLAVLGTAAIVNWLPTRYWLSALFVGAGLGWLVWPYLPLAGGPPAPGAGAAPGALACLSCALLWATWRTVRPPLAGRRGRDRVWLDFRDQFGAFWALRVAERMNVALAQQQWPLVLGWSGFSRPEQSAGDGGGDGDSSPLAPAAVDATLHSLLRRFVSRDWIAARTVQEDGNQEDLPGSPRE